MARPYSKVNWTDGVTPENAATLGQMDQGIKDMDDAIVAVETGKQDISEKGDPNGYPPLDADGKIPVEYLPPTGGDQALGEFTFNDTVAEPPGGGQVRMDNATQTAATKLWISETTAPGADAAAILATVKAGEAVYIQDKDDSTRWQAYTVTTDALDKGTYKEIAVTFAKGGSALNAGQRVLAFVRRVAGGGAGSAATLVTSLPASPVDGQEVILVDSLTAPTFSWRLRYVAAKATNKWLFVGGSPRYAEVPTEETTASTSYVALTTPGPSVAVPVAGDYEIGTGLTSRPSTANSGGMMSFDIGATAAADAEGVAATGNQLTAIVSAARTQVKTLSAVTLTAKYKSIGAAGTTYISKRWLSVRPVAIGG